MDEQATTETTATETATTETTSIAAAPAPVATTETPQSFIDSQGNFTDGWKNSYVDEDIRGEAIFDRMKSIRGMTKTLANQERMKGSDTINKPSDKFGDGDWDDFHTAGGWTNQAIAMAAPEGIPDGIWSEDRATKFSEKFNELRLNPKQQAGLVEFYNSELMADMTNQTNNDETAAAELKAGLLADKGNAYIQFQHNGNIAIDKGVAGESAEFKARIVAKYGNDPDLVRLLGNLGSNFAESGSIPTTAMAPTPNDLQTQINEIMKTDAFMKPMHPDHKATMATVARLHKEKAQTKLPA